MTDPMSAPAWPPTEFPLPRLWERAKAMFAVIMREARSLHALVTRPRMTWPERTSLLCRLVPVEKLVRSLIVTEAIIHLLMTPHGRKLLATTKPVTPPPPPAIATLQQRLSATEAAAPPQHDSDPEQASCAFRVLAWQFPSSVPEAEDDEAAQDEPEAAPRSATVDARDDAIRDPAHKPRPGRTPSTQKLARRIAALSRILENPQPAIRRLAKFIAGLSPYALELPSAYTVDTRWWWHGRPEFFNACALERRAVVALDRTRNRPDDPG